MAERYLQYITEPDKSIFECEECITYLFNKYKVANHFNRIIKEGAYKVNVSNEMLLREQCGKMKTAIHNLYRVEHLLDESKKKYKYYIDLIRELSINDKSDERLCLEKLQLYETKIQTNSQLLIQRNVELTTCIEEFIRFTNEFLSENPSYDTLEMIYLYNKKYIKISDDDEKTLDQSSNEDISAKSSNDDLLLVNALLDKCYKINHTDDASINYHYDVKCALLHIKRIITGTCETDWMFFRDLHCWVSENPMYCGRYSHKYNLLFERQRIFGAKKMPKWAHRRKYRSSNRTKNKYNLMHFPKPQIDAKTNSITYCVTDQCRFVEFMIYYLNMYRTLNSTQHPFYEDILLYIGLYNYSGREDLCEDYY